MILPSRVYNSISISSLRYEDVYKLAVARNGVGSAVTGHISARLGGAIVRMQGSDLLPYNM